MESEGDESGLMKEEEGLLASKKIFLFSPVGEFLWKCHWKISIFGEGKKL